MYFMKSGTYQWSRDRVGKAHTWCQDMVRNALSAGMDVVVANTFTTRKEIQPYLDMCKQMNIPYMIVKMVAQFQSIHNVPEETMRKMAERWEDMEGEVIHDPLLSPFW